MFFFFKLKTAYDSRISDWSSDVCSSDLLVAGLWRSISGLATPLSKGFFNRLVDCPGRSAGRAGHSRLQAIAGDRGRGSVSNRRANVPAYAACHRWGTFVRTWSWGHGLRESAVE